MGQATKHEKLITELMKCLDSAADRLRDISELLDLDQEDKERLKRDGAALISATNALKADFRSLKSLGRETRKKLEPHLR
jgi:uncharacterized protein Yka (UPF0111/DUF47 family)